MMPCGTGMSMTRGFVMQMSAEMQECIQNCTDCHTSCLQTAQHCLQMGGKHAEANHIRMLLDCAEICQTSANFMTRMSQFHGRTCGACAEICEACAKDCDRFADDQTMRACADMCRRCSDSCRRMAGTIPM